MFGVCAETKFLQQPCPFAGVHGIEWQHCIAASSIAIADMQSPNGNSKRAATASAGTILLPMFL